MKKNILITDSGLGGLSVFAQIAESLSKKSPWPNVSMVYFNAWPEQNRGYNHLGDMKQKAEVFNNALNTMETYQPDKILIACNTLSVIYPFTAYSQNTKTKVSGIVDHGVQLIYEHLVDDNRSHVIIFGTPTTITEKSHQQQLIKMGITPDRITGQGCINLAGKIERDPFSNKVKEMINANVLEAVSKIDKNSKKIYAALCCTHFGYCNDLFQKALSRHLKGEVIILNPNQRMADREIKRKEVESQNSKNQSNADVFSPDIDMKIVSRVFWEPERIDAYVRLLEKDAPNVVKALIAYEWEPGLFEI